MLPQESPQTCNTKSALVEMYRSLTVGSILGVPSAAAISWHTQSPHAKKLLRALSPHIDQIAEIILHHTPTVLVFYDDLSIQLYSGLLELSLHSIFTSRKRCHEFFQHVRRGETSSS